MWQAYLAQKAALGVRWQWKEHFPAGFEGNAEHIETLEIHSSEKLVFSKERGKVKALDGVFLNHPVHALLHTGAGEMCAFVLLCHQLSQVIQMANGRDLSLPQKNG